MNRRIELDTDTFNDLSRMCDSLNIDWFYFEYINRKTIDSDDVDCIRHSWDYSWQKENRPYLLTDNIRKLFNKVSDCETK